MSTLRQRLRSGGALIGGLLALTAATAFNDDKVPLLAKESRKGVALLKGYSNGQGITGTGFLIDERTVITNAHVVQGANVIVAEFDGGEKIDCSLIDLDAKVDLAALSLDRPLKAHALLRHKGVKVVQGEKVLLIGHPLGLTWSVHEGRVAAIRTLGEIAESLGSPRPPNPGQIAIQLDITSTQGMSGAPVLNSDGDVIGIQKEGWKDGLGGINFCIPQESVDTLDLTKHPRKFSGGVTLGEDFKQVGLQTQRLSRPERPAIRVDDRVIDVGCQHWGFVPADADFVFNVFIGDKARFGAIMPKNVVQEILYRHKVVQVTNSAFGFGFLVPDNYELAEHPEKSPLGLKITLTNRDPMLAPELKRAVIHAWRVPKPEDADALTDQVKDIVSKYAEDTLGLNIHDPYTQPFPGVAEQDVVMILNMSDGAPRTVPEHMVARYHVAYASLAQNKGWSIFAAVANDTAIITDYVYMPMGNGQPGVTPDSAERQFVAETVSFDSRR